MTFARFRKPLAPKLLAFWGLLFCSLLPLSTAQAATDTSNPRVSLKTDLGTVVIELLPQQAPVTVANFLRYSRDGFYAGTIFHRVVPGFVVQGGGLTFDYIKKDTRDPIVNESDNGLRNLRGTLSMARYPKPDSATSQFFINLNDNPHLDPRENKPGYAVFARVVEGMDVVDSMTKEPLGKYRPEAPDLPIRILSVSVEEPQ